MSKIETLSIKHYGVTFTIPSEILLLSPYYQIESGTHLTLEVNDNYERLYFGIIKVNGENKKIKLSLIEPWKINELNYKECSIKQYYKLRAFL